MESAAPGINMAGAFLRPANEHEKPKRHQPPDLSGAIPFSLT